MKAKGIIAAVLFGTAAVVGTAYGVGNGMKKKEKPVEVVPVTSVNEALIYGGDSMMMDSLYGTIISKDTQSVELDTDHAVKKVYVEQGDRVKKGDKLMTYDMELDKLKREEEELTKQGLQISLDNLKKDLATMESGKMPETSENSASFFSPGSGGYDSDTSDEDSDDAGTDYEDDDYTTSDGMLSEADSGQADNGTADDGGEVIEQDVGEGELIPEGDESGSQVILDDGTGGGDLSQDDGIVEDEAGEEPEAEPDEETLIAVNTFLDDVNTLTDIANAGFDGLSSEKAGSVFQEAFGIFRSQLSASGHTTISDLFGESREITVYQVSGTVASMAGDATARVLKEGYDRACVYWFINAVRSIFPGQSEASDAYDYETVKLAEDRVRRAADAFYMLQDGIYYVDEGGSVRFTSAYSGLNDVYGGESYGQYLIGLIRILNTSAEAIFPEDYVPDSETEMTEPEYPDGGYDDFDGGDGGDSVSAEDLKAAIEQQKKDIKECELQIRETDLSIKEYNRTLSHETVTASMDGIVKQAGTTTERPASGGFIVVTGKTGLYVQGTLSERSLDTMKVGDTITGSSWDSPGLIFDAEITEISDYPQEGDNTYFYYGMGSDPNSSQYPFLAYIDQADGLTPDMTVQLSISQDTKSASLMLDPYMVRTEPTGKTYCYVRGEDGKLEKRYVKAKDNTDYQLTVILSGLRAEDFIAFPYGDDVKEGAPTVKTDSLSAVEGDMADMIG